MSGLTRGTCFRLALMVLTLLVVTFPAAAQEVTIDVWLTAGSSEYQQLLPDFHASHPNIKVNISPLSWSEYEEKIFLAFATNTAPDIIMTGASFIWHVAANDFGMPIDRYVEQWGELDDFAPGALASMMFEGKLYGLPLMAPSRAFWYRKDIFMEHGLNADNLPETWEDIRDAARRIVRYDGNKVTRIGISLSADIFVHALLSNGVRTYSDDLRRPAFNTPEGLEALEFWSDLTRDMQYLGRERDLPGGFYGGTIGMMHGYISPRTIAATDPNLFDFIGGPGIMERRVKRAYTYPDWVYITTQSKHPDEAWEVMKWLTDPMNLAEVGQMTGAGHPSPRKSSYTHPFYETPEGRLVMRHFLEATLQYGHGFEPTPETNVRFDRTEMWNRVVNQVWPARQALDWLEQQYNLKLNDVFSRINE